MDPARWKVVKEVAADAMELPRDARTAYLTKACADDADLRAQVDRLLIEHDRPAELFRIPTPSPESATRADPSTLLRKQGARDDATPTHKYLPPEFLEQSIRRLGYLALFYAVAYVINYVVREIIAHGVGAVPFVWSQHGASGTIAAVFILGSLAVYVLVRRGFVGPSRLTRAAVAFQIVGAFGIAVGQFSGGGIRGGWDATLTGISWACVWIVVFPFMVPLPQRVATLAAVCAALMDGVGIAIWVAAGTLPPPPANALVAALVPNLICAGIASVVSRIIYRWGAELGRAQRLGSYQLESLLGRGGMGEVWVARHHMLARPAALKLIRPEVLAADAVVRFEREAQSTAALTSPHTIKLYDYGTTPDGVFYYAMELLQGFDLDTLVRRFGPVPPERAVHFLLQVCESLAEAHESGLVHRDIKPANIYVGRQGVEWDFVKVLDFGLVVSQDASRAGRPSGAGETKGEAKIVGTPAYMAPESVRGDQPDPRTDLYALGCVGSWLVTGRPVFEGEGPIELAMAHVNESPLPPSQRAEQDVSAELDEVLLWCLQKERAHRPPSAQELAARLRGVAFAQPWTQERAREWWAQRDGTSL